MRANFQSHYFATEDEPLRRVFKGLFAPVGVQSREPVGGAGPGGVEAAATAAVPRSGRILFVDDEQHIVQASSRLLQRVGHTVTGFTTGSEAISALESGADAYDLVVSDLNMPGTSGLEVARVAARASRNLAIMIISGSLLSEEMTGEALMLGIHAVLLKPVRFERLVKVVEAALCRAPISD